MCLGSEDEVEWVGGCVYIIKCHYKKLMLLGYQAGQVGGQNMLVGN